jgi:hypothetical protein
VMEQTRAANPITFALKKRRYGMTGGKMKTVITYQMATPGATEIGTYMTFEGTTVVTPSIGTTLSFGPQAIQAKVLGYLTPVNFKDKTIIRMICRKVLE